MKWKVGDIVIFNHWGYPELLIIGKIEHIYNTTVKIRPSIIPKVHKDNALVIRDIKNIRKPNKLELALYDSHN